ncbi:MAG: zinc ribbon domain-containing protein [bacterium]|nr:zinc ribbon domain-containing protein [bacterium]
MPLYDYKCPNCEHPFEARHSFSESAPPCPACGHVGVQRVILTAPKVAKGLMAHPGDGRSASKEQLQDKWAEETPKLRKKLADKLGEDTVNRMAPTLNMKIGE